MSKSIWSLRKPLSNVVLCLLCIALVCHGEGQNSGLSYAQVEHLIKLRAPDSLVASQIRSRGINFSVTNKSLEGFTAEGAGPEAIAALRERIKVGVVQIQTEPGSLILLDGKSAGNAGTGGLLVLKDVAEGSHSLAASKGGFKDGSLQFVLARNENKQVSLPLVWLGGYLSISAKPEGATIAVSGPISLQGSAPDVQCPLGRYTATVSLEGYLTQTRTFQVGAGEHHTETFELAADPAVLAGKLNEAKSKLAAADAAGALKLADVVSKQAPNNSDVALVIAEAAFQVGDMNRFVDAGTKAIRGGRPVTIRAMHAHTVMSLWIHPTDITITESGISLVSNPPDSRCKIPASVGFELISNAQVVRNPQRGFIELHIQYASKPHGAILHDLDFVPEGSGVATTRQPGQIFGGGTSTIQEPGDSGQILDGILRLMVRARR